MQPDLNELAARISGRILTDADDTAAFLTDWRSIWHGKALGVVQPTTTAEVAEVVRWCVEHNTPIVPQGGNTGLSGGATPDDSGQALVLSLARLNRIRAVDTVTNTMTVDAGCILQTVQEAADAADRFFPLSLAAEGSCTIGGNLACNAGGTAVLRYGAMRELCLGLEVVTPQGEVWDGLRSLRKDNTGYDLRDLYIGSEGSLGVITGAVLKLFPKPAARVAGLVALATIEDAIDLFEQARARFDTSLTAFELISDASQSLVLTHCAHADKPLETQSPWYALVEFTHMYSEAAARADLENLFETGFEAGLILDGVIAASLAQSQTLWALRESIAEAQSAAGKAIKHDISLPISRIPAFVAAADAAISARWPDMVFVTFGHLGDGNLHYNFSPAPGADQVEFYARQTELNRLVHDLVSAEGGSISAEHGLGVLRRDEAARYKSPVEIGLMRTIKQALDPHGLMNPGKLLS